MALAYSITSTVNAIILVAMLNKKIDGIYLKSFFVFLLKTLLASGLMGVSVLLLEYVLDFNTASKLLQVLYLIITISAGALVYFAAVCLLKVEEAVRIYETAILKVKNFIQKF